MYFAILDSNKVTGTVIALKGFLLHMLTVYVNKSSPS